MNFTNENWYHLCLEDGNGGTVDVSPFASVDLPPYFEKYSNEFEAKIAPGHVYTIYDVGSPVVVYSNNEILSNQVGTIIDKDEVNYKIDFGSLGIMLWFYYTAVEQATP